MIKFDKEELLKIAELSALKLENDEIKTLAKQLQTVIQYTKELDKVELAHEVAPVRNVNVFREDVVKKCNSEPILAQAPQEENNYFVVPRVLK